VADFRRIGAASRSLKGLLLTGFEEEPPLDTPTNVALVRTDDLHVAGGETVVQPPAVSLLLYRCDVGLPREPVPHPRGGGSPWPAQPLSLHFLATAWAASSEQEHHILGRTLQVLDDTPILTGPRLDPSANWSSDDAIRLSVEDASIDDLTRIFLSLGCAMRLSILIVARL
jgi:hypothetical protein